MPESEAYVKKWEMEEEDTAIYLPYYFGLDVGFSISALCLSDISLWSFSVIAVVLNW